MWIPVLAELVPPLPSTEAQGMADLVAIAVMLVVCIFGVIGVAALLLFKFGRSLPRPDTDPTRLRSVVCAPTDLSAPELAQKLVDALGAEGIPSPEPVVQSRDDAAYAAVLIRGEMLALRVRGGPSASVEVLDRAAVNRPITESDATPIDRKAARELLEYVDRAVRRATEAHQVRWFKREDWSAGRLESGAHQPVEA